MIYFVTPAWQRFELTKVVLEQRQRVIDFLAERDVEARCVVVADDLNADIAAELGFDVVRKPNYALGRRFNDGIEYAARHGAEWIVPIGSDSFIDPAYLFPLPAKGVLRSSHLYALAEHDRLGRLRVDRGVGVGPYMLPSSCLPRSLRPAEDWRKKGIDASTIRGLRNRWKLEFTDLHPWQYVGFRRSDADPSHPQMNSYDKLYRRIGVSQEYDVALRLSEHYPRDLVERALAACAAPTEVAA